MFYRYACACIMICAVIANESKAADIIPLEPPEGVIIDSTLEASANEIKRKADGLVRSYETNKTKAARLEATHKAESDKIASAREDWNTWDKKKKWLAEKLDRNRNFIRELNDPKNANDKKEYDAILELRRKMFNIQADKNMEWFANPKGVVVSPELGAAERIYRSSKFGTFDRLDKELKDVHANLAKIESEYDLLKQQYLSYFGVQKNLQALGGMPELKPLVLPDGMERVSPEVDKKAMPAKNKALQLAGQYQAEIIKHIAAEANVHAEREKNKPTELIFTEVNRLHFGKESNWQGDQWGRNANEKGKNIERYADLLKQIDQRIDPKSNDNNAISSAISRWYRGKTTALRQAEDVLANQKASLEEIRKNYESARVDWLLYYPVEISEDGVEQPKIDTAWVDNELLLVEELTKLGYDDLASQFLERTKNSKDWYQQSLSSIKKAYIDKSAGMILAARVVREEDLERKAKIADEAAALISKVIAALPEKTTIQLEAQQEYVVQMVRIAGNILNEIKVKRLALDPKEQTEYDNEFKEYFTLYAKWHADVAKIKYQRNRTQPLPEPPSTEGVIKNPYAKQAVYARNIALRILDSAIDMGLSANSIANGRFDDLAERYNNNMQDSRLKNAPITKEIMKKAIAAGETLRKIHHAVEEGYVLQAESWNAGSKEREETIKAGEAFIADNRSLYETTYKQQDFTTFGWWMRLLALKADKPWVTHQRADERGNRQEVIAKYESYIVDTEDYFGIKWPKEQLPEYYLWSTDKIKCIYQEYVVGRVENTTRKTRGALIEEPLFKPTNDPIKDAQDSRAWAQDNRIRALAQYARAAMKKYETELEAFELLTDRNQKEKALENLKNIYDWALAVSDEVNKNASKIGLLDPILLTSYRIQDKAPWHIYLANRAWSKDQKEEANLNAETASMILTQAITDSPDIYKSLVAREQRSLENWAGKRGITIETGGGWVGMVLKGRDLLRAVINTKSLTGAEKQAKLLEARDLLLDGYMEANESNLSPERRESMLPEALVHLGIAAAELKDYELGYIVNSQAVTEFNPRKYPPSKYTNASRYVPQARNNLIASASQLSREKPSFGLPLYIEALWIAVQDGNDSRHLIELIKAFTRRGEYENAIQMLSSISSGSPFSRFRLIKLAEIEDLRVQQLHRRINTIQAELGRSISDERKAELENQLQLVKKEIEERREKALAYAQRFLNEHLAVREQMTRLMGEIAGDDPRVRAWTEELTQVPLAMILPIEMLLKSEEYDKALEEANKFLLEIPTLKQPLDVHNAQMALGYFEKVKALVGLAANTNDLAKAQQYLAEASGMKEAFLAADTRGSYTNRISSILGNAFFVLADKISKQTQNRTLETQLKIEGANWFELAENRIYVDMSMVSRVGRMYLDEKLYDKAYELYEKAISFWVESQFRQNTLFQPTKTLQEFKSTKPLLTGLPVTSLQNAATPELLAQALNEWIKSQKDHTAVKNDLKNAQRILTNEGTGTIELFANIEQAIMLAEAEQNISQDEHNFIYRIWLEAAYPSILFTSPRKSWIPPQSDLARVIEQQKEAGYQMRNDQKQGIILAMINRDLIRNQEFERLVFGANRDGKGGYMQELSRQAASGDSFARTISGMFNPGLEKLIYGVMNEDTKKVQFRDYGKARMQIVNMLKFDQEIMPTAGASLPIESYLKKAEAALLFQSSAIAMKKDYARAMVAVGEFENAQSYLESLIEFFPNDVSLQIDMSLVLAETAARIGKGENQTWREYSEETAALFAKALVDIAAIQTRMRSIEGSALWWDMMDVRFRIRMNEAMARKHSNAENPIKCTIKRIHNGKWIDQVIPGLTLENLAKEIARELQNCLLSQTNPPSEDFARRVEEWLEELRTYGYTLPVIEAVM